MSFLFRSVRFCFLFLLTREGQVEGDLRPVALLDLKWPCRVLLRRVFQQASGSLSCPSSSFSSSGSSLPPSSHPIISHSSPYPYWHEMYHQQLLFLGCLLQNGANERGFDNHANRVIILLVSGTIVDQIIVEAGRSRVPQHLPLHDARNFDVVMQKTPKLCILGA